MRAGLGLHAADIARQMHEAAGALDLDRLARGADRQRRLRNRGADDRLLQPAPVHHAAQRAADIKRQLGAELAGLARGLRHRQTDARRRSGAERGIGAGGDRQTDAGQPQHQFIGRLAQRHAPALAHRVANIAEHKQIAERGAGQTRHVIGLAGRQTEREALRRMLGGCRFRHRDVHFFGQRRIERHMALGGKLDEALGQIGVLGGERRIDLALRQRGIEICGRARGRRSAPGRLRSPAANSLRSRAAPHSRRAPPARRRRAMRAPTADGTAIWSLWRESLRVSHAIARNCGGIAGWDNSNVIPT